MRCGCLVKAKDMDLDVFVRVFGFSQARDLFV